MWFTIHYQDGNEEWSRDICLRKKNLKTTDEVSVLEVQVIRVLKIIDCNERTESHHVIIECDSFIMVNAFKKIATTN